MMDTSCRGSVFTAPELGPEGCRYGHSADVYSLGLTLCALWARAGSEDEALDAVVEAREQGRLPPALPRPVRAAAAACLQVDSSARPAAGEVLQALRRSRLRAADVRCARLRRLGKTP